MATKSKYYIHKSDLLAEATKYVEARKLDETAVVHRRFAEMLWLISQRMGSWGRYRGYPFIEDMIMDGVEDCIRRVHNFNPEKYDNAFGYISRIIEKAFHRKIHKEKKQLAIKISATERSNVSQDGTVQPQDNKVKIEFTQSEVALSYLNYGSTKKK